MIKETCSCGAEISVSHGYAEARLELEHVEKWRDNHRHESQSAAQDDLKVQPEPWVGRGHLTVQDPIADASTGMWAIGRDYVLNGDGEPVWIGDSYEPRAFILWSMNYAAQAKALSDLHRD